MGNTARGTKKTPGKVWMFVDEPVRKRLNRYKQILDITDTGVTDQNATLTALLDKVGAPGVDEPVQIVTSEAVQP